MKTININSLSKINGGTSAPGCGTVGAMTVLSHASGGMALISSSYWSTLWTVCWNMG